MKSRSEQLHGVIGTLNAIHVGDLQAILGKLGEAGAVLRALEVSEIESALGEARQSLLRGDMPNFRRLVAQVVARLGHLR